MNHITELIVNEVKVKGGARIMTAKYMTPNAVMHQGLYLIGKAMRWFYEIDSNNASVGLKPRNIRDFWKTWNVHKQIFDIGFKNYDAPGTLIEVNQAILLPHPTVLAAYKNMKIQQAAFALHDYSHVVMSKDGSSTHNIYNMADKLDIDEMQAVTEEKLKFIIGTGERMPDGSYDIGADLPSMNELGLERPSGDLDLITFNERSSEVVPAGLPDSPDHDAGPLMGTPQTGGNA